MTGTVFKKVDYTLSKLIQDIQLGEIALPDIQRPFVWPNTKVRDLFDSMFRGFPVGYLLFWQSIAGDGFRQMGTDHKQQPPRLLIVDGQQRLTSLFAVLTGTAVVRENYKTERIEIAFRPTDQTFEVADAAIRRDSEFITDISALWSKDVSRAKFVRTFIENLRQRRNVDDDEADDLGEIIDGVYDLQDYPFTALELSSIVDEEQVADVFVRINSAGTLLSQADFILTLMSVFWDKGRTALEEFSRESRTPSMGPGPYNHFIQPAPDQLLRVGVALAFRRARLQFVYSILRGKDLETGEFSAQRREEQFAKLAVAQERVIDLLNWQEFFKVLVRAGFRRGETITSKTGILYTYALFLIGKRDFRVDPYRLRNVMARWFFMSALTGRYTSSPESVMEQDLARLRDVKDPDGFIGVLDTIVEESLTADFWNISLPGLLATTSAYSPALFAYYAALNLLDARVLFSKLKVAELMDPATKGKRKAIERHHLFPKGYLQDLGIRGSRQNRIANLALVEWPDNAKIADRPPKEYWPELAARFTQDEFRPLLFWHGLPEGWENMDYWDFLDERQRLLARVVRDGFATLWEGGAPEEEEVDRELISLATQQRGASTAELIAEGESAFVEFKESARWSHIEGDRERRSELDVVRTLAGFLNAKGGTLLIGVNDQQGAIGLARDYKSLQKRPDRDGFANWLTTDVIRLRLGAAVMPYLSVSFASIDGRDICRIDAQPGSEETYVDGRRFFLRVNNTTQELHTPDVVGYVRKRWPGRTPQVV